MQSEYVIIMNTNCYILQKIVNIKISEGFKLIGGVSSDRYGNYIQAMIRENKL